jgi:hypothetical protein
MFRSYAVEPYKQNVQQLYGYIHHEHREALGMKHNGAVQRSPPRIHPNMPSGIMKVLSMAAATA